MRAAVAFCMLALAGCTLQRGYVAVEPTTAADRDDFVLKPVAGFPVNNGDCEAMPNGSCELRPPAASTAPTSPAPRPIASGPRSKTLQQTPAPTPVVVDGVVPPAATDPMAASAPAQLPESKPVENDRKTAGDVLTDAAITALIIQASREAYYTAGRSCPCPYDLGRNGRLCGSHSAHSRPGRPSLRCFATDVTAEQIADYRAKLASEVKYPTTWRVTGHDNAIE
jgi:hypothetical protein